MDAAQIKAIFDMLAPIVGLATLLFGVVQYRNAQRWKKKELIAKEAKEFFADPAVKTALRLMDWHRCKIVVPSFETPPVTKRETVDGPVLAKALEVADRDYDPVEVHIRDVFDQYLEGLQRFENYVSSGLVSASDVEPYLAYWFAIMAGDRQHMDPMPRAALATFMRAYGYDGVIHLMRRCGYRLEAAPPGEAVALTKSEQ